MVLIYLPWQYNTIMLAQRNCLEQSDILKYSRLLGGYGLMESLRDASSYYLLRTVASIPRHSIYGLDLPCTKLSLSAKLMTGHTVRFVEAYGYQTCCGYHLFHAEVWKARKEE